MGKMQIKYSWDKRPVFVLEFSIVTSVATSTMRTGIASGILADSCLFGAMLDEKSRIERLATAVHAYLSWGQNSPFQSSSRRAEILRSHLECHGLSDVSLSPEKASMHFRLLLSVFATHRAPSPSPIMRNICGHQPSLLECSPPLYVALTHSPQHTHTLLVALTPESHWRLPTPC